MTQCATGRTWTTAASGVGGLVSRRLVPFITMVVASLNVAAGAAWVPVAASPDVQVFVDAESLQQESHGLVNVWTKTFYASPQGAVRTQYAADMTLFVLDCASHQYGIAGADTFNWLLVLPLILYRAVEKTGGANPYRVRHAEDAYPSAHPVLNARKPGAKV
jgi:hypothetical protein